MGRKQTPTSQPAVAAEMTGAETVRAAPVRGKTTPKCTSPPEVLRPPDKRAETA